MSMVAKDGAAADSIPPMALMSRHQMRHLRRPYRSESAPHAHPPIIMPTKIMPPSQPFSEPLM